MGELGQAEAGAEIGEEAEVLAQGQERAPLGLLVGRQGLPLWSPHRPEEDRLALLADLQRLGRKGLAGTVDRRTADEGRGLLKSESELLLHDPENLGGLGHDFGSDAVSGQHCDAICIAHGIGEKVKGLKT